MYIFLKCMHFSQMSSKFKTLIHDWFIANLRKVFHVVLIRPSKYRPHYLFLITLFSLSSPILSGHCALNAGCLVKRQTLLNGFQIKATNRSFGVKEFRRRIFLLGTDFFFPNLQNIFRGHCLAVKNFFGWLLPFLYFTLLYLVGCFTFGMRHWKAWRRFNSLSVSCITEHCAILLYSSE